jgi:dethiobiotin synthetase
MSGALIVTGTDTGIGKTVVAAGLAAALAAYYWKPIQAGTHEGTDSLTAQDLGVPAERILPERYRLALPASPHLAAEAEGTMIDPAHLTLPEQRPLVVEGAGGLMVPMRRDPLWLMIDQFAAWSAPVLLVARTALGTINHTMLSIEAMNARSMRIAGIVFVGDAHDDNEATISQLTGVPRFGRLPLLATLNADTLAHAIASNLDLPAIRAAMEFAA